MGPTCKMRLIYILFISKSKIFLARSEQMKKKSHFRCVVWRRMSQEQGTLESSSRWLKTTSMKFAKPDGIKSNQIETEARNTSTNLVEMLSELNPMVEQFVPPSLANHDKYFDNRFRFTFVCFSCFKNILKLN